jgi:hypothetical protein
LVGDELHDAAQTARTSRAVTVGRRRRSGTSFMQSIVTRRMPPEQGPKSLLRGPLFGFGSAGRQNRLLAGLVSGPPSKVLGHARAGELGYLEKALSADLRPPFFHGLIAQTCPEQLVPPVKC